MSSKGSVHDGEGVAGSLVSQHSEPGDREEGVPSSL